MEKLLLFIAVICIFQSFWIRPVLAGDDDDGDDYGWKPEYCGNCDEDGKCVIQMWDVEEGIVILDLKKGDEDDWEDDEYPPPSNTNSTCQDYSECCNQGDRKGLQCCKVGQSCVDYRRHDEPLQECQCKQDGQCKDLCTSLGRNPCCVGSDCHCCQGAAKCVKNKGCQCDQSLCSSTCSAKGLKGCCHGAKCDCCASGDTCSSTTGCIKPECSKTCGDTCKPSGKTPCCVGQDCKCCNDATEKCTDTGCQPKCVSDDDCKQRCKQTVGLPNGCCSKKEREDDAIFSICDCCHQGEECNGKSYRNMTMKGDDDDGYGWDGGSGKKCQCTKDACQDHCTEKGKGEACCVLGPYEGKKELFCKCCPAGNTCDWDKRKCNGCEESRCAQDVPCGTCKNGKCKSKCSGNEVCDGWQCVPVESCGDDCTKQCGRCEDGKCVDLDKCKASECKECKDGECIDNCPNGKCVDGECQPNCDPDDCSKLCNGKCVNDKCEPQCPGGGSCVNGKCDCDPQCDSWKCEKCDDGKCVSKCSSGQSCKDGQCSSSPCPVSRNLTSFQKWDQYKNCLNYCKETNSGNEYSETQACCKGDDCLCCDSFAECSPDDGCQCKNDKCKKYCNDKNKPVSCCSSDKSKCNCCDENQTCNSDGTCTSSTCNAEDCKKKCKKDGKIGCCANGVCKCCPKGQYCDGKGNCKKVEEPCTNGGDCQATCISYDFDDGCCVGKGEIDKNPHNVGLIEFIIDTVLELLFGPDDDDSDLEQACCACCKDPYVCDGSRGGCLCDDWKCKKLKGSCYECNDNECVPITCGPYESCQDGQCKCVPSKCTGNCTQCQDGQCVSKCDANQCQKCKNGNCVSTCGKYQVCNEGTCEDTCKDTECEQQCGKCKEGKCTTSCSSTQECDGNGSCNCDDNKCQEKCSGQSQTGCCIGQNCNCCNPGQVCGSSGDSWRNGTKCDDCENEAKGCKCDSEACDKLCGNCVGNECKVGEKECPKGEKCVNGEGCKCDNTQCTGCFECQGDSCVSKCDANQCQKCKNGNCVSSCGKYQVCNDGNCEDTCKDTECEQQCGICKEGQCTTSCTSTQECDGNGSCNCDSNKCQESCHGQSQTGCCIGQKCDCCNPGQICGSGGDSWRNATRCDDCEENGCTCDSAACDNVCGKCVGNECKVGEKKCPTGEKCVNGEGCKCDPTQCTGCFECQGDKCASKCDANQCEKCKNGNCVTRCSSNESCDGNGNCVPTCNEKECWNNCGTCVGDTCTPNCGPTETCDGNGHCNCDSDKCPWSECKECKDNKCVDTCPNGKCNSGVCEPNCKPDACKKLCNGQCIDGVCQPQCPGNSNCINGICQCNPKCDSSNCEKCEDGVCVSKCQTGETCKNGKCKPPPCPVSGNASNWDRDQYSDCLEYCEETHSNSHRSFDETQACCKGDDCLCCEPYAECNPSKGCECKNGRCKKYCRDEKDKPVGCCSEDGSQCNCCDEGQTCNSDGTCNTPVCNADDCQETCEKEGGQGCCSNGQCKCCPVGTYCDGHGSCEKFEEPCDNGGDCQAACIAHKFDDGCCLGEEEVHKNPHNVGLIELIIDTVMEILFGPEEEDPDWKRSVCTCCKDPYTCDGSQGGCQCDDWKCKKLKGSCYECNDNECVPITCGPYESCQDGQCKCVPSKCTGNCTQCQDGQCVSKCDANQCQKCKNGNCVSTCGKYQVCNEGTCEDTCKDEECEQQCGKCKEGQCTTSCSSTQECDGNGSCNCDDNKCQEKCSGQSQTGCCIGQNCECCKPGQVCGSSGDSWRNGTKCDDCENEGKGCKCDSEACDKLCGKCVGNECKVGEKECPKGEKCVNGEGCKCDNTQCTGCFECQGDSCVSKCDANQCQKCKNGNCVSTCGKYQVCNDGNCEDTCKDTECEQQCGKCKEGQCTPSCTSTQKCDGSGSCNCDDNKCQDQCSGQSQTGCCIGQKCDCCKPGQICGSGSDNDSWRNATKCDSCENESGCTCDPEACSKICGKCVGKECKVGPCPEGEKCVNGEGCKCDATECQKICGTCTEDGQCKNNCDSTETCDGNGNCKCDDSKCGKDKCKKCIDGKCKDKCDSSKCQICDGKGNCKSKCGKYQYCKEGTCVNLCDVEECEKKCGKCVKGVCEVGCSSSHDCDGEGACDCVPHKCHNICQGEETPRMGCCIGNNCDCCKPGHVCGGMKWDSNVTRTDENACECHPDECAKHCGKCVGNDCKVDEMPCPDGEKCVAGQGCKCDDDKCKEHCGTCKNGKCESNCPSPKVCNSGKCENPPEPCPDEELCDRVCKSDGYNDGCCPKTVDSNNEHNIVRDYFTSYFISRSYPIQIRGDGENGHTCVCCSKPYKCDDDNGGCKCDQNLCKNELDKCGECKNNECVPKSCPAGESCKSGDGGCECDDQKCKEMCGTCNGKKCKVEKCPPGTSCDGKTGKCKCDDSECAKKCAKCEGDQCGKPQCLPHQVCNSKGKCEDVCPNDEEKCEEKCKAKDHDGGCCVKDVDENNSNNYNLKEILMDISGGLISRRYYGGRSFMRTDSACVCCDDPYVCNGNGGGCKCDDSKCAENTPCGECKNNQCQKKSCSPGESCSGSEKKCKCNPTDCKKLNCGKCDGDKCVVSKCNSEQKCADGECKCDLNKCKEKCKKKPGHKTCCQGSQCACCPNTHDCRSGGDGCKCNSVECKKVCKGNCRNNKCQPGCAQGEKCDGKHCVPAAGWQRWI